MSSRRKRVASVFAAFAALAAIAGFAASGVGAAKAKPIVVGISLSLSGDFSNGGQEALRGYQLWAADVNARGGLLGRPVTLRVLDDASSPQQVVTNYQKLIATDHVNLVFGPFSTFLSRPASVVVARYGYAFFSGLAGGPALAAAGLRNVINIAPDASRLMDSFANAVVKIPSPPTTAAYLTLDNPFTKPEADRAKQVLESRGVKTVVYEVYNPGLRDFGSLAAKVVAKNPDIVVLGSSLSETVSFIQSFIQQKWNPKALIAAQGPDEGSAFPKALGAANTEGILGASVWNSSLKTFGNAEFVQAYVKKYGGEAYDISGFSAYAYATGQVAEQVVKEAGTLKQQRLIGTAYSRTFKCITGAVLLGVSGFNTAGRGVTLQWQGGKPVVVFPADRANATFQYPKKAWAG